MPDPKPLNRLVALLVALLGLHLAWEYVWPGTMREFNARPRSVGCYKVERLPDGKPFRWCQQHAQQVFPIPPDSNVVSFIIEAGPQAQEIVVTAEDGSSQVVALHAGEQRRVVVPTAIDGIGDKTQVAFDAASTFIPSRLWPASTDDRRLAFKVLE